MQALLGNRPAPPGRVLSFGLPAIDAHLPYGGLAAGALHECAGAGPDTEHGALPARLIAGLLAHTDGPVIWIVGRTDLFAPGLAGVGLHPDRVVHVEAGSAANVLASMEDALRQAGLAAVVGELDGRLTLTASRRLQLAAGHSGTICFLLRRSAMFDDPRLSQPSAAVTRWRVAAQPSLPAIPSLASSLGRALWRLELRHCRGAAPAHWIVEACDATGRLALPAELGDRSLETREARRAAS